VWADHIQVQKLAAVLERPIWLILYDDIQLQRDMDGNLIPGRDYNIGNGKVSNTLLLQRSVSNFQLYRANLWCCSLLQVQDTMSLLSFAIDLTTTTTLP